MFSLKEFVKKGLLSAVGRMADYQVILNAAAWLEKGVLDEADLLLIQTAIEAKNETASDAKTEAPTDAEPDGEGASVEATEAENVIGDEEMTEDGGGET